MFGVMTVDMESVVREVVRDMVVWDLGAGPALPYAGRLVQLGATRVVAVDKLEDVLIWPRHDRVEVRHAMFADVLPPEEGIDVAFVSWPVNRRLPGLVPLLEASRTVVYLGKNSRVEACGSRAMFDHLLRRDVLRELQHARNDLVVYGPVTDLQRPLLREELWGLENP